jgi:hypothetical protein
VRKYYFYTPKLYRNGGKAAGKSQD